MTAARVAFRILCSLILLLSVAQLLLVREARSSELSEATHGAAGPDATTSRARAAAEAVAFELESKRQALNAREVALIDQEARLKERERALDNKIKELERLREAVTGELESQRKDNEERVVRLVAVFETMSPKSAAAVFETLDDWLAVEVLKKMDVKRVAKVMNVMEKTRSAKLSEILTGYYRPEPDRQISSVKASNAEGQAQAQSPANAPQAPQNQARKGGDK